MNIHSICQHFFIQRMKLGMAKVFVLMLGCLFQYDNQPCNDGIWQKKFVWDEEET